VVTLSTKRTYRLYNNPDFRLILRCLAEQYDSKFSHNFDSDVSTVASTNEYVSKEIARRFYQISNHADMFLAQAYVLFPEVSYKTVKTNFMRTYADIVIARLTDDDTMLRLIQPTRAKRMAARAAKQAVIN
jgi:hypothetical protein